jgi:two-component system, chemotaxis family, chemotaxis protein CheY
VANDTAKRVLVIDDASLVRMYYRGALEGAGFEVAEAINGLEALEHLLAAHFDLVIVDVNMPQMDGLSFLRVLRAKSLPLSSIPALVISSEAAPQRVAAASAAGANFYIVKPLRPETLVQYASLLSGARNG